MLSVLVLALGVMNVEGALQPSESGNEIFFRYSRAAAESEKIGYLFTNEKIGFFPPCETKCPKSVVLLVKTLCSFLYFVIPHIERPETDAVLIPQY